MSTNGILVDFEWCSGCHTCEIACKNEKGFDKDKGQFGVKVLEVGPWQLDETTFEWNYIPAFTQLCDLCKDRVATGEQPSCVQHCLANCLTYGPVEELSKTLAEKGKKIYLYLP
jgi:Fe-S-cluster-containing dehydrogenase component